MRGSVVTMSRVCGKAGCRCTRGEKLVSLCLAVRGPTGRRMVYVPRVWEETVRRWVGAWREADDLIDVVSRECVGRFLAAKDAGAAPDREKKRRRKR